MKTWKQTPLSSSVTEINGKVCDSLAAVHLPSCRWFHCPVLDKALRLELVKQDLWPLLPKVAIISRQLVKQCMTHKGTATNSCWALCKHRAEGSLWKVPYFWLIFFLTSVPNWPLVTQLYSKPMEKKQFVVNILIPQVLENIHWAVFLKNYLPYPREALDCESGDVHSAASFAVN